MRKTVKIIINLFVIFSLSMGASYVFADWISDTKNKINEFKSDDSFLPGNSSSEKWSIWFIFRNIFNASGEIKKEFLEMKSIFQKNWNNAYYNNGLVWIGTNNPDQKLTVKRWNIRLDGNHVGSNRIYFTDDWSYWGNSNGNQWELYPSKNYFHIYNRDSNNSAIRIYNNGDVRIWNNNTNKLFEVNWNAKAKVFYDKDNSAYYVDPASTSHLNHLRANIVYDRNNTSYYVDPASTSKLNNITVNWVFKEASGKTIRDAWGGWVRTYWASGWYNWTYWWGWNMVDWTWIRAYGGKSIYTTWNIKASKIKVSCIWNCF